MGRCAVLLATFGFAAGVVAACSPDVQVVQDAPAPPTPDSGIDPNDGAHSGLRLKLTWYAFTDGTRQWSGMYDAERKEYCSPYYTAWTDGNVYCTPEHGGDLVYTDANCTNRAMRVYVDSTCPTDPPKYYLDESYGTCDYHPAHLYLRTTKLAGVATYHYKNSNGTCGIALTTQSYDSFYALPSEVPTSDLVKLTLSAPAGTGRLGVRSYTSSDGMTFPWVLHDSQIDADCSPSYYSDTATAATCVPSDSRYAFYSHDAVCAQPELDIPRACTVPKYAYTFPQTSCPYDQGTYYAVGAKLASSPLFYASGPSCVAATADATEDYYGLGAQLTAMPIARAADTATSHRIQLVHFTTADGLRYRDPYSLYDAQEQTQCYPQTLPDGTIRCVAYGGYINTYYNSSACTTTVDVVELYTGPASCMPPTVPKFARKSVPPPTGSCTYADEIHPITTPHVAAVYTGVPGACNVYTPTEYRLYNIGATTPITDFVGAAIVTDP